MTLTALGFEVIVGALTFTGSLMAAAKLQELLPGRPITYRGQNILSLTLLGRSSWSSAVWIVVSQAAHAVLLPDGACCRWSSACCWSSRSARPTCRS